VLGHAHFDRCGEQSRGGLCVATPDEGDLSFGLGWDLFQAAPEGVQVMFCLGSFVGGKDGKLKLQCGGCGSELGMDRALQLSEDGGYCSGVFFSATGQEALEALGAILLAASQCNEECVRDGRPISGELIGQHLRWEPQRRRIQDGLKLSERRDAGKAPRAEKATGCDHFFVEAVAGCTGHDEAAMGDDRDLVDDATGDHSCGHTSETRVGTGPHLCS
jgi:hypothetical protein